MIVIDRCLCFQESFAALYALAQKTGAASFEELQKHVTFGENCRLCRPYVERMLETGETTFHQIIKSHRLTR